MIDFNAPGRMISASKTAYVRSHPNHIIVFNAVVYNKTKEKLWWGDLNITLDEIDLKHFAKQLNDELTVLREFDAASADHDRWSRFIIKVEPNGEVIHNVNH